MKTLTKTKFKQMHDSNELQLICGMVKKNKEDVVNRIKEIEDKIHEYVKPTTNYGNIESDKIGSQTCNIYITDDEQYILIEYKIDNSKNRNCSWNTKEVYTTAYLAC